MALIANFIQAVRSAIYGEEVRGSIADALNAMNNESENAYNTAMQIDTKYEQTLEKSEMALTQAQNAQTLSKSASEKSEMALIKSTEALPKAIDALSKATSAKETAERIEWKAVQALNIANECERLNSDAREDAAEALRLVRGLKQIIDNFGNYYIRLPINDSDDNPILDSDGNQIEGVVSVITR